MGQKRRQGQNQKTHKESFQAGRSELSREIQRTINYLRAKAQSQEERFAIESLVRLSNGVFALWEKYVQMRYHFRMAHLEESLARSCPALEHQPLARQAILFLLGMPVPGTVLAGMRQLSYVRQLHEVYGQELPAPGELMAIVAAAEIAFDEV